ncbi:MAG: hypothetical protein RQ745_03395 [Longimicrobiales bacterium]|nr:hypothetical protein [Longimicrobiales bacterium]
MIAALIWAALSLPIAGTFRWVGEELAMPPIYAPMWRGFLVVVGVVLVLAFVVDPRGERP